MKYEFRNVTILHTKAALRFLAIFEQFTAAIGLGKFDQGFLSKDVSQS